MLFLYHSTTSVCAIKVRLTLAEKGLAARYAAIGEDPFPKIAAMIGAP